MHPFSHKTLPRAIVNTFRYPRPTNVRNRTRSTMRKHHEKYATLQMWQRYLGESNESNPTSLGSRGRFPGTDVVYEEGIVLLIILYKNNMALILITVPVQATVLYNNKYLYRRSQPVYWYKYIQTVSSTLAK